MRLVLIEACDPQRPIQVYMPMGLAYLKSYLERLGAHQVFIERDLESALARNPEVIGISCVSPNFPHAIALARQAQQFTPAPLILGGAHISGLPQSLPREFNAGVIGEGEQTLEDLLSLLSACPHPRPEQLRAIPGLVWHKHAESPKRLRKRDKTGDADVCNAGEGQTQVSAESDVCNASEGQTLKSSESTVEMSAPRQWLSDLDALPIPRRDWIKDRAPALWSFSSRGCPYKCTFCSTANFWERYRLHSPRYVTDELKQIMERHNPGIHIFMDDLFAANVERLKEMRALFKRELPRSLPLVATVRADLVTPAIAQALRDLGVVFCHLGLESASDRVLSYLKNQTTTAAINQRALDLLSEYGLKAVGSFIIGAPNEDDADLQATWDFIDKNSQSGKLQSFSFGPLVAFPGTKVWDDACARFKLDWRTLNWHSLDIDVRAFDLERYLLLSPLERPRFGMWFERFKKRWESQNQALTR